MMIVKVKSNGHAFTIPVPYALLRMGSGILTSNLVRRIMRDSLNKHGEHAGEHTSQEHEITSDAIRFANGLALSILESGSTKHELKQLINVLQHCKGTVLVDVQAQDGSEVFIKL